MKSLYDATKTKRYHTRNVPRQTTGDHTAGMLTLLEMFHPKPTLNLYRAILRHDYHEKEFGDNPSHAKSELFKTIEDDFSLKFHTQWYLEPIILTTEEQIWLEYLDKLEVLYYIGQFAPALNQDMIEIYNHTMPLCLELEEKLKTFGYMSEPKETVH